MSRFALRVLAGGLPVLFGSAAARADVNVWLDFNANWVTELGQATTDAGVPAFTPAERLQIQTNILDQVREVYAGYRVNFSATDPGGLRDRIDFGVDESAAGSGTLGFAPVQIGNFSTGDTLSMLPRNFATFLEAGDPRATQIAEISRSFSGTTAHEFGHSVGLLHHHTYGNPGITPANYANTGGLQNQHIMATGSSGLSEAQRESPRSFGMFERAMLDITGGTRFGGDSLVDVRPVDVIEAGDAGNTTATAAVRALTPGQTSGMLIGLMSGDLDGSATDADVYRFVVPYAGLITAESFSDNLYAQRFDGRLRLIAADGVTVLGSNDDVSWNGNAFNSGSIMEIDPFLLNIPVPAAGTYFIELTASASPAVSTEVGDDYTLMVAFVPEPSLGLTAVAVAGLALGRRRSRR